MMMLTAPLEPRQREAVQRCLWFGITTLEASQYSHLPSLAPVQDMNGIPELDPETARELKASLHNIREAFNDNPARLDFADAQTVMALINQTVALLDTAEASDGLQKIMRQAGLADDLERVREEIQALNQVHWRLQGAIFGAMLGVERMTRNRASAKNVSE